MYDYGSLIPTSPRSVEACLRKGIDPLELQFKPMSAYKRTTDVSEAITRVRFEKSEAVRQVCAAASKARHGPGRMCVCGGGVSQGGGGCGLLG